MSGCPTSDHEQKSVYRAVLLDFRKFGYNVFVFGCFYIGRQIAVTLHLTDNAHAVDSAAAAVRHYAAHVFYCAAVIFAVFALGLVFSVFCVFKLNHN